MLEQQSLIHQNLLSLKEQKKDMSASLARKIAEQMKEISQIDLSMEIVNLYCSLFEDGRMSKSENRKVGKILLEPLFEKSGFMKDRCVAAYIQSIRDDKSALSELGEMLQERSFTDRYLEYIAQLKEKSIIQIRKGYLEDEKMRFITTNIIDIDGTLDYGIGITGKQNLNLNIFHMIAEHPEDDFAICTRRIYDPKERLETCKTLINYCEKFLEYEPENKDVAKFMELIESGRLKAYSKNDLINNEHVCLAGSVTDDEMPEILGIQSLTDATVSVYQSEGKIDDALKPLWKAIPESRKMTLQEFENEKLLPLRMGYLEDSQIKFITTELIDFGELLTPKKELDTSKVKLLLNKQNDWALVISGRDAAEFLKDSDDETICRFQKVVKEQDKIIDRKLIRKDDVCLTRSFVHPKSTYRIKNLTDDSISIFSEPVPMDPRIQKAYEQIPVERKMTIQQYKNFTEDKPAEISAKDKEVADEKRRIMPNYETSKINLSTDISALKEKIMKREINNNVGKTADVATGKVSDEHREQVEISDLINAKLAKEGKVK